MICRGPRLVQPPEAGKVIVQLPDSPPAHSLWRNRTHCVKADGPERILGECWV